MVELVTSKALPKNKKVSYSKARHLKVILRVLLLDIWQLEAIVLLLILNLEQHADKQCHNAE